jgi:hypothetical protein
MGNESRFRFGADAYAIERFAKLIEHKIEAIAKTREGHALLGRRERPCVMCLAKLGELNLL